MTTLFTPGDNLTNRHRVFDEEMTPHMGTLYNFARSLTNDVTRADDLVQETFMKAWRFLDGYTVGTNARAWLYRICKHVFINDYRSKDSKIRKVSFEDFMSVAGDETAVLNYSQFLTEVADQSYSDEVLRALNSLNPTFREVVLLDLEDFSYEEIAKLTEVPIGTVRSRLHRARGLMADNLRDYARENGYGKADVEDVTPNETAASNEGNSGEVAVPNTTANSII